MKKKTASADTPLSKRVMYMGPHVRDLGLGYGYVFKNGLHANVRLAIEQCPALGELFIPIDKVAEVRRELNFDIAHNMRGRTGNSVIFYREIQKWLALKAKKAAAQPSNIKLVTKHA